jgi:hypothetical protein
MIALQEPSKPLATLDRVIVIDRHRFGSEQAVAEPLVMSLGVVVLDKLPDAQPEMLLAEGDDVVETLASNGSDKALGKGIEISDCWTVV